MSVDYSRDYHLQSEYAFSSLIAELLVCLKKIDVQIEPTLDGGIRPDITFGSYDSLTMIEVKFYRRSSPPPVSIFNRALQHTAGTAHKVKAKHTVLAISCPMEKNLSKVSDAFPNIDIWDENKILNMASPFPELFKKLEGLFEIGNSENVEKYKSDGLLTSYAEATHNSDKGSTLASNLRAISPGRKMATDFEKACIDALRYLFENDLHGWYEQSRTIDSLHRRDLVCRILANSSEVWRVMLDDLKSRYVIFEFKNYNDPITQNEIITTERYLYPSALRKVAIVISQQECADSAKSVIAGAMREHGKLIIHLSVKELINLLIAKDSGSDPNTYLFERVDEFLLSLGR